MSNPSPNTVIGCLLDVSDSMREAFEAGRQDEQATERLLVVLQASLQIARTEHAREPDALMFVGIFGLKEHMRCPTVVDLCGIVEALLDLRDNSDGRSGHELLVELANQHERAYIARYIRTKLTDDEARIVHRHLQRNPEQIKEFRDSIPTEEENSQARGQTQGLLTTVGKAATTGAAMYMFGRKGVGMAQSIWGASGATEQGVVQHGLDIVEGIAADNSKAMGLARKIWDSWWQPFAIFQARPIANVINVLDRLQDHAANNAVAQRVGEDTASGASEEPAGKTGKRDRAVDLLDNLRDYIYGLTPMEEALSKAKSVFDSIHYNDTAQHKILILLSDGHWNGADPLNVARSLTHPQKPESKVHLAVVHLTSNNAVPRRRLYNSDDNPSWDDGQHTLLRMASKVSALEHPIPVFASMGWEIPPSGEVALYILVNTTAALDEFFAMLLSARFGSADALLDIVGRTGLDDYINDEYVKRQMYPSDQGDSATCYAHATAAVLHMALCRVILPSGRNHPNIKKIRNKILEEFPPTRKNGYPVQDVLERVTSETWFHPIYQFSEVDENGARQAVLHRRPVLATFGLSKGGWDTFGRHFENEETAESVLTTQAMAPYRSASWDGGHAVVLVGCGPQSLTFLNSWGSDWGKDGAFSVENHRVLGIDSTPMRFYDVFWIESDLSEAEVGAYTAYIDDKVRSLAARYPVHSVFEAICPLCDNSVPVLDFTGSIRRAVCPLCERSFVPEPEQLIQALYVKAGLGKVEQK